MSSRFQKHRTWEWSPEMETPYKNIIKQPKKSFKHKNHSLCHGKIHGKIMEFSAPLGNPQKKLKLRSLRKFRGRPINNPRSQFWYHIEYKELSPQTNLLCLSYKRNILDIIFLLKSYHHMTEYIVTWYLPFKNEYVRSETRDFRRGSDVTLTN